MPHSSGGGSSGGGFHSSGSSGGGGSSYRSSRTYFPGSTCYVYYDSRFRPHALFTNVDPASRKKTGIGGFVFLGIFALAPIAVILLSGFHNPKKISTDYPSSFKVVDNTSVISAEEEEALLDTFHQFYEVTGVSPSLVTIKNADWKASYASLSGYSYDLYLNMFKDESHWLFVYADDDGNKGKYNYELMQGNDTDPALSQKTIYAIGNGISVNLEDSSCSIGKAFDDAIKSAIPKAMESYFEVDPGAWVFTAFWEAVVAFLIGTSIIGSIRNKNLSKAVKAPKELVKKSCEYCGNEYYEGTLERCPKCGALLKTPTYASFEEEDEAKVK
ncbi:MAG: hypothetical protein K6B65_03605 [Bacilli bacterium]|nr:hypothetical protein [Bacilli bacterium]